MFKRIITLTAISSASLLLCGQGAVGSWNDHLSYSSSYSVAAGGEKVYSSAGSSLLVYDIRSASSSPISRVTGLNETAIGQIEWCEAEETVIIVYRNTAIDLVRKGVIYNIPDIKNKYIPGLKEIYGITVSGSLALLAGSFGIVVIDIRGKYVADTWRPGPDGENNEVHETAILGDRVYAATSRGVFSAPLNRTGLSYFGNWDLLEGLPSPASKYNKIVSVGSALFLSKPGSPSSPDSLFRIVPGESAVLITTEPAESIRSLDGDGTEVLMSTTSSIIIFSSQGAVYPGNYRIRMGISKSFRRKALQPETLDRRCIGRACFHPGLQLIHKSHHRRTLYQQRRRYPLCGRQFLYYRRNG